MLQMMRDNAGSWIIKILLGVIVLVFIFLGLGPDRNAANDFAAEVNKTVISWDSYQSTYNRMVEMYRGQFGGSLSEDLIRALRLREQALEKLISDQLMLEEAKRQKLVVSVEELNQVVKAIPDFQVDGVFSKERYETLLKYNGLTDGQYEDMQRRSILINKLRDTVQAGAQVTEGEIEELYKYRNTEVSIDYAVFDPAAQKEVRVDDAKVEAYYKENGARYETEPEVKLSILRFAREDYTDKVAVTDEDVALYYEDRLEEFQTPETAEARHILFELKADATEEDVAAVKARAEEVYTKAVAKGADFSVLAKEFSEGPSKEQGGLIGPFTRQQVVKPFADAVFAMEEGTVSKPVRTSFGWHIIKLEKMTPESEKGLDEVKSEIRASLLAKRAEDEAYKVANDAFDTVIGSESLKGSAEMGGYPTIETDFFTRSKGPEAVPAVDRLNIAAEAFNLAVGGMSEILEYNGSNYIIQVTERKEPEVPELATVREKVEADALTRAKEEKAKELAQALLDQLSATGAFPSDTSVVTSPLFLRDGKNAKGLDRNVVSAAFGLSLETPRPEAPVSAEGKFYVIQLKERKFPTLEKFSESKETLKQELLSQKRNEVFSVWLKELRDKAEITRSSRFAELQSEGV
ncbi:MAG: SurA N-terminal domain-containing protein [Desulfobacterales bacterium]|nr:SurA N-terminal domain-containing protein [Desulfobacterales bacterium]